MAGIKKNNMLYLISTKIGLTYANDVAEMFDILYCMVSFTIFAMKGYW